jgi:4-carboxymuconolactone decarboxylase
MDDRPATTEESPMSDDHERLEAAYAMRRSVLGDEYVDRALAAADGDPIERQLQDYITGNAWGVWARGGPLSMRDRSLLVLAMTAALGRMDEFTIHATASPRAGVTDAEVDELIFQIAAYCGAPAAVAARRAVTGVRALRDDDPRA